jgi:hypothetical protein
MLRGKLQLVDMSLLMPFAVVAGMVGSVERCLAVRRSFTHSNFRDVGLDVGRNLVGRRGWPESSREKLLQWG